MGKRIAPAGLFSRAQRVLAAPHGHRQFNPSTDGDVAYPVNPKLRIERFP
jgi:hypothetical protein